MVGSKTFEVNLKKPTTNYSWTMLPKVYCIYDTALPKIPCSTKLLTWCGSALYFGCSWIKDNPYFFFTIITDILGRVGGAYVFQKHFFKIKVKILSMIVNLYLWFSLFVALWLLITELRIHVFIKVYSTASSGQCGSRESDTNASSHVNRIEMWVLVKSLVCSWIKIEHSHCTCTFTSTLIALVHLHPRGAFSFISWENWGAVCCK